MPIKYDDDHLEEVVPIEINDSWWKRFKDSNIFDLMHFQLYQGCIGEFIGTFLLVFFVIGLTLNREGTPNNSLLQISLGCGFFIAVIVTNLSTVSGSHLNPAVSAGFFVVKRITLVRFILYWIIQVLGGIAGAYAIRAMMPSEFEGELGMTRPGKGVEDFEALIMEAFITGFLTFGVMSCIDQGRQDVNGSIAFIIGLIVLINVLLAGEISGAAMNPARALGPAVVTGEWQWQWIYWIGDMTGGMLGAWLYEGILSTHPIPCFQRLLDADKLKEAANTTVVTTRVSISDVTEIKRTLSTKDNRRPNTIGRSMTAELSKTILSTLSDKDKE